MERTVNQTQPFGICHRLFKFLMNNSAIRCLKRITLGRTSGLAQEPVDTTTKPIEGVWVDIPVHGTTTTDKDSLAKAEHEQTNGLENSTPVTVVTPLGAPSPAHVLEKGSAIIGGSQTQLQKGVNVRSTIPTDDPGSKIKPNDSKDNEGGTVVGDANNGPEKVVVPTAPKKTVSINDGAEKRDLLPRRKEKKEKLTRAIEPEKDVSGKASRPLKPILRSSSNINEKSDLYIQRKKESHKRSSSTEP